MNKFDRFMELFHNPKWQLEEFAQAILWYHIRSVRDTTGEKTADIPTVLMYFPFVPKNPPTTESLEKYFRNPTNGVEAVGDRYFVPPPNARWFERDYGEKVFGSDLPDFVLTSDQAPALPIPVVAPDRGKTKLGRETRDPARHDFVCPWCAETGVILTEPATKKDSAEYAEVSCPYCKARVSIPLPNGQMIRVEVAGRRASEVENVLASTFRRLQPGEADNNMGKRQPSQTTDIAILVALDRELDAVLRSAGSWERHQYSSDTRTYYTSTTAAGLSVVAARASGMGQINAALLARDIVALFKPRKVLLVGIAAGLGKEVSLGDLVVSDQIVDYEVGKVTAGGATPRWSVYRSDALLRERLLDHRDASWLARVRIARPDGDKNARPAIHSGVVLSGNKVIADARTAGALAAVWSRASAIEMEAAGIAAALDQSVDAPGFVMVKAVCDRADAAKNDSWQEYAAEVSAAFVASFVFGPLQPGDARGQRREKNLPTSATAVDFRSLRLILSAAFDLRELKILVSDLGLDWDNIAGDIKDEKIVEVLWHMNRRARIEELIALVRTERPGLLDAYSPGI